jgi:hypothetical protein
MPTDELPEPLSVTDQYLKAILDELRAARKSRLDSQQEGTVRVKEPTKKR